MPRAAPSEARTNPIERNATEGKHMRRAPGIFFLTKATFDINVRLGASLVLTPNLTKLRSITVWKKYRKQVEARR